MRLCLAFTLLLGARGFAQTCDRTWTGNGGNNDWYTPGNWTPAVAPVNGQSICFTSNSAQNPNISSSFVASTIAFQGNGTITISSDPLQSLTVNGGVFRTGGTFVMNVDTLVLGASQTWTLGTGTAPAINSPLQAVGGAVLTKTGGGGLVLNAGSFPLGGIVWGGTNVLTVTATNALGSGTPVSLATGSSLLLNAASQLNLGNNVTVTGASGTATVAVTSSVAGTRHVLGQLTVPTGADLTESTSGTTNASLQIAGLTLNGTATLTKTSTGNGGLWINGPVTDSISSAINLNIGVTNPTSSQYDEGLHFTSDATVASTINTDNNGNAAFIGADGAATLSITGTVNMGAGNPVTILVARSGGRIVFAPSTFTNTNQDTQIRGDPSGVVAFASAAAPNNRASIYDNVSWETDVNALPTRITFNTPSGGSWLVRNTAQTTANNAIVTMSAPGTIDTGTDLTIAGQLQGSAALTKTGAGTLTLTQFSSYSGPVTVNAGTLVLGGSTNNSTQSFTINSGGTLSGTGGTKGAATFAANANLTPGVGLTLGNTSLNDASILNFTVGTNTTTVNTGTLTLDGVLNITAGTGFAQGTYTLFNASAVPVDNVLRLGTAPTGFTYTYDPTTAAVSLTVGPAATAVTLVKSDALTDGSATRITWEAGTEVRNLGYRIYREQAGQRQLVSGLIPGSALRASFDPVAGRNYSFVDPVSRLGGRYWIQAIDVQGKSEWLGPVDVRRTGPGTLPATYSAAMLAPAASAPLLAGGQLVTQVDPVGLDRAWRDRSFQNQWKVAATPGAVKLLVRQDGVYRVPLAQLHAAGLPAGTSIDALQLWAAGRQVAFRAAGNAIEFFGQAADTRYTDTRVYWVTAGLGRPTTIAPLASTSRTGAQNSFLETLEIRERTLHIAALMNPDTNGFYGPPILGTDPLQRVFSTPSLAIEATDPAVLEVSVQGLTNGAHALDVVVNGMQVGTVQSLFQDVAKARFTLPPGLLVPGDNTVTLAGHTDDEIAVELSQRLTYPRQYAFGGPLRFTAPAGADVLLTGADPSRIHVLDITSAPVPGAVDTSAAAGGVRLTAGGSGTRILYAYRDQDVLAPVVVADTPSTWHDSSGADLVVIGPRSLLPSLRPLAQQRASQGISVALVDVEDVYDEFSAGQKDAMAIQAFLSNAVRTWDTPPRFVLLAGAATYDPRGWLGHPELDQVPTVLVQSRFITAASDDPLVTVETGKSPTLAVGRLPFSNTVDMDAAVAKIIGRSLASKPDDRLLLIHDRDGTIDFSAGSAEVKAALAGWNTQDFARGPDDDATRAALVAALREGPIAVDYQGHGAEDFWAGRILSSSDSAALAGSGKSSLLVASTCLNAYFVDIGRESLGAALLRTPNGGSWGVWASSALTLPTEHALLSKTLLSGVLIDGLTLGEATLKAKEAVTDPDVRNTFQLLGDPSARAVLSKASALTTTGAPRSGAFGCSTPGAPIAALAPLVLAALALSVRRRRAS